MPSIAQQVREAIVAEIAKVSGIGYSGGDWQHWANQARLPAAYTILDSLDKERRPTARRTVVAHYRIATLLQSQNPENDFDTLAAAIETQVEDDPMLGGLVEDCYVVGYGPFATAKSIAGEIYTRDVFIDATYKHEKGSP